MDWKKIVKEIIEKVELSLKVEFDLESPEMKNLKDNPVGLILIQQIKQLKNFI